LSVKENPLTISETYYNISKIKLSSIDYKPEKADEWRAKLLQTKAVEQ